MMTSATIQKIIGALQAFYFVIGAIALIALLSGVVSQKFDGRFATAVCTGGLSGASYWGLFKRKSWTPTFILYTQAMGLVAAVTPLRNHLIAADFFVKWFIVAFAAVQIWFFTRPNVRRCFEARGNALY
jgi:hypothetical protein